MSLFDVGNWLTEQAQELPQAHIVEGIPFDLLSLELNDSLLQEVKSCESYTDMVMMAADNGLAYYDVNDDAFRVVDNKRLSKKIAGLWDKDELQLDTDPCIKERVGLIVCEISGLSEFVEDQKKLEEELAKEEAEKNNHLDGSNLPPGETELDNLSQANLDRAANQ